MATYVNKGLKVGFLVNASTAEIRKPELFVETLQRLRFAFGKREIIISIAYGKEQLKKKERMEGLIFLPAPCPQGEGVLQGFNLLKDNGAAKLFYVNFDNLASIASKLPEMSLRVTGKGVATAKWADDAHLFIPQSMFISEKGISKALAIALPSLPQDFHFYLGLMGLPSKGWERIEPALPSLYAINYGNLQKAGIDAGLLLAASHAGLSIDNSTILPIRFSHTVPKGRKGVVAYAESRVKHFLQEMGVIEDYLRATGQQGKIAELYSFITETQGQIVKASFHWPTHRIIQSENPSGQSSFM